MKRCFLLVFTLFMLISCAGNDIPAATDTTFNITENSTDFITMSTEVTTAEDTTSVSSVSLSEPTVRYEKQYNVTKIATTSDSKYQYQYRDKFYQTSWSRSGDERRICLTSWNADRAVPETIYYPDFEPDMIPPPRYIFPLSDGRTLMVHFAGVTDKESWQYETAVLTLLDAENQVIIRREISELSHLLRNTVCYLHDNGDGTFECALVTEAPGFFYLYDETLTELQKIPTNSSAKIISRIDDNTYRIGTFTDGLLKINTKTGITRPHGNLRLPDSIRNGYVLGEYTDQIYFSSQEGLYRYRDGEQPKQLIEWIDSPFSIAYIREHGSKFYIIDDTHMFVESQAKLSDGTSTGVFYVEITEVPVVEKLTLTLAYIGYTPPGWLNDQIYFFNQKSTEYRIELQQHLCKSDDEMQSVLNELLLTVPKPDIFFCDKTDCFSVHNGKNIYLDLSPVTKDTVFGCIYDIHGVDGQLYQLPLAMTASLLVSPSGIVDGALTWTELDRIINTLEDNSILTSDPNLDTILYQNTLMQFVDRQNKTTSFDSDAFATAISVLQKLDGVADATAGQLTTQSGHYCITNGMLPLRIADGGIKFLSFHFSNIRSYGALRLIFGDTPFAFCGYPTVDGTLSARICGESYLSVSADTAYPDGALAFVSYLLSDEAQTDSALTDYALPVTPSAMQAMLDLHRWQYYDKQLARDLTESPDTQTLFLSWHGTTPEFDPGYGNSNQDGTPGDKAAELFHVMTFTEEEDRRIMDFFNNVTTYIATDDTVERIANEELSFWQGNARTLSETTKIIDSRVWIYLNE